MEKTPLTFAAYSPTIRSTNTLLILFALFLLGFLWVGLYFKIGQERQVAIDGAVKETANFARVFEEHTRQTIKSADEAALYLKYRYEREGRGLDIPRIINEGRFASPIFVLLSVIDENGDLAVSSQVPFTPSNLSDRAHFLVHQRADTGKLYISKPVFGRSSGKWSLQVTRRVNKPDGTFGGVVVVSVDPAYFTGFYQQVDLGEDSSVTLVDSDGIILARRDSRRNTDPGQTAEPITANGYKVAVSAVDGVRRVFSFRLLDEYPLAVAVGVAESDVLRAVDRRAQSYLLATLLITGAILAFIAMLLKAAARQKCAEKALLDSHNELERKVEQRTRELFDANRHLAVANSELQQFNQDLAAEVADRKRAEEALRQKTRAIRRMAFTDALTGLPNRAGFNKRLGREMAKARGGKAAGAVVFIDLDDLKIVNDSFGHTYGDALITMTGNHISEAAGSGAFVARVGGDEFVVILPGESDRVKVGAAVDEIVTALAHECEVLGVRFHVTASAGVAVYPADGQTAEEIFKNADNAMYAAKRAGKNRRRFFEPDMEN